MAESNLGRNIVLYNLKALEQIFKETKDFKNEQGVKKSVQDKSAKDNVSDKEDEFEWRRLPSSFDGREHMIIASGGECQDPSVVPKQRDNALTDSDLHLLRRELDVIQDMMRKLNSGHVVQVCMDYPGVKMSRDYYLDKIEQLMTGCKLPGGE